MRQLPTLRLFKIRMDLEMERGTDALAAAAEAVDHRGARGDRAVRPRRRRDPRAPGRHAGGPRAVRARRGRARHLAAASCSSTSSRCASAARCAAWRRSSSTAAPGFSANGMGVWKVPEERILELAPRMAAVPRHLALLPAAHLRRLALLGLHDGPRALEGGVRRDPRLDRRGHRHRRARARSTPRPSSRRSGCSTSPTSTSGGKRSTRSR